MRYQISFLTVKKIVKTPSFNIVISYSACTRITYEDFILKYVRVHRSIFGIFGNTPSSGQGLFRRSEENSAGIRTWISI